jgi:hypothetical protein
MWDVFVLSHVVAPHLVHDIQLGHHDATSRKTKDGSMSFANTEWSWPWKRLEKFSYVVRLRRPYNFEMEPVDFVLELARYVEESWFSRD